MTHQEERQQDKEDERAPPPRKVAIVRFLRALKRQYHRYAAEAEQRKADHTENERSMARWTRQVGIFTIVLSIISGLSAGISYWALLAIQGQLGEMKSGGEDTKRLIEAAQQSAKAAQDTVDLAKETAQRQLRAYVSLRDPQLTVKGTLLRLELKVHNAGQTPAYITTMKIDVSIYNEGKHEMITISQIEPKEFPRAIIGRDLSSLSFIQFDLADAKPETMVLFNDNGSLVLFRVVAAYRDIFQTIRHLRMSFRGAKKEDGTSDLMATPEDKNEAD